MNEQGNSERSMYGGTYDGVHGETLKAIADCRLMAGKTWMPAAGQEALLRAAAVLEADVQWMETAARCLNKGRALIHDMDAAVRAIIKANGAKNETGEANH